MYRYQLLAVCMAFATLGYNQSDIDTTTASWNVTYSPSALINSFIGTQFGIERKFSPQLGLELEGAYIHRQPGTEELHKQGFRAKLGIKKIHKGGFMVMSTLYLRRTFHQHREEVLIDRSFIQEIDYKTTKTLIGPTIGIGFDKPLGKKFGYELTISGGIGHYSVREVDLPTNADQIFEGWFNEYKTEGNYPYPIIAFSVKLKYQIYSDKRKSGRNRRK